MKKLVTLLLTAALVLALAGCGKISANVEITNDTSQYYSEADIHDAISVAQTHFRRHFDGCTLTAIGYAGDEEWEQMEAYADDQGVAQAIILTSEFATDDSGSGGVLNPNDTYRNYQWVLLRKANGGWSHFDHGYG